MQVGVVTVGQPFPFWVRGQSVLTLRVATARPEPVVRLALGAEVSVAPCPRVKPQAQAEMNGATVDAQPAASSAPATWLRIQVSTSIASLPTSISCLSISILLHVTLDIILCWQADVRARLALYMHGSMSSWIVRSKTIVSTGSSSAVAMNAIDGPM